MRLFASRHFHRFAARNGLDAPALSDAARGLRKSGCSVDLGGGVFKVRIARPGAGKSGGFRTLVICVQEDVVVFQFGFAKNERDNIDAGELRALKAAARVYAAIPVAELATSRHLVEIEVVR